MIDELKTKGLVRALLITVAFSIFYFIFGTLDLENRMTAVHSLVKKSKATIPNANPNVETFLGFPIYDYSLGLGTNLPITSGLSRISTLTFFIDVSDDIFTILFISLAVFATLYCLIQMFSEILNSSSIIQTFVLTGLLYPLIIYTMINDWTDVAISYLSLVLIQSSLIRIRQGNSQKDINSFIYFAFLLGITLSLFGQTGYLPIVFLTSLAQIIFFGEKYISFFKSLISEYRWLTLSSLLLFLYAGLNLFHILSVESNDESQMRESQQLRVSYDLFEMRQPNILAILVLVFFLSRSQSSIRAAWKKELLLVGFILLLSWNSSVLGIIAPSSEWLIRDYFWIQLFLLFCTSYQKFNTCEIKLNSVKVIGLILVLVIFSSPFTSIFKAQNQSRSVSWINPSNVSNSQLHELLSKRLLVSGDRVFTAPSELIRNRGGGISGLLSYSDLTSQGITSISSWTKMRDSSALVYNEKMFENRAFTEDCNRFTVQLTSPTVVIADKSLLSCIRDIESFGFVKTWSNDKFAVYRGISNIRYEIPDNGSLAKTFDGSFPISCGFLQKECASFYEQKFLSYSKFEKGGPFCQSQIRAKGWCLEFDKKDYERFVIVPVLFEATLTTREKLVLKEIGGLTAVKVPKNFEGEISLRYKPSPFDLNYYIASLGLSLILVHLAFRVFSFCKISTKP
jgi:hypothetical protein